MSGLLGPVGVGGSPRPRSPERASDPIRASTPVRLFPKDGISPSLKNKVTAKDAKRWRILKAFTFFAPFAVTFRHIVVFERWTESVKKVSWGGSPSDVRMCRAGCPARRVGYPPYPAPAARGWLTATFFPLSQWMIPKCVFDFETFRNGQYTKRPEPIRLSCGTVPQSRLSEL